MPLRHDPEIESIIVQGRNKVMRFAAHAVIATAGVVGFVGSAFATDLTGAEIKTLLSGNTVYLQTTAASSSGQAGQGIIYWAADGTALFKTNSGSLMHGTWVIKDNTNCTDWKERPGAGCVRYDKTGDTIKAIDAASGQVRATIVKTAPGNTEKLGP
jgi:hypothetical protein